MLQHHKWKLGAIIFALNVTVILTLAIGNVKHWSELDWLDIVGEGGVSVLAALWLLFLLNSRPAGPVTSWLTFGLGMIFLGSFHDFFDEVVALPQASVWRGGLESTLMPLGLVILTFGLYHWHREQQSISKQMRKREQLYREYRLQDGLTGLGDARYLKNQLASFMEQCRKQEQPLALVLLDLDHFDHTNRQFGPADGDRLLRELTELLVLNIRRCDLLCRYAGDRFAIVLPNTSEALARELASQLARAVEHFAFRTSVSGEAAFHTASTGTSAARNEPPEALIERATCELLRAKDALAPRRVA